ncbi:hypothetical protein EAO76_36295 [Streptomyces sp. sk2.1]|nr:hypothetical protein EAO76_36295 [Streptomyces sp. sk2.1]
MTPLPGPPPGNAHPGPRPAHAAAQPQDDARGARRARPFAGAPSPYPTHPDGTDDAAAGPRTGRRTPDDTRRTRPGTPAGGTVRAARQTLVALLLAVLAVVGGAPASTFPARPFAGAPPSEAHSPGGHRPTPHTDRTTRTGIVGDTRRTRAGTAPDTRRGRTATATDHHRPASTTGPGPGGPAPTRPAPRTISRRRAPTSRCPAPSPSARPTGPARGPPKPFPPPSTASAPPFRACADLRGRPCTGHRSCHRSRSTQPPYRPRRGEDARRPLGGNP